MRSNRVFNMVRSRLFGTAPKSAATPVAAEDNAAEQERARHEASLKATYSNGSLPGKFSINLGAAPCNHSCRFCPQSVHKPRRASWLDLDLLRKVASEMPEEGMEINISSYSETLAAPNLLSAIRLLKEVRPKLRIAMATNGSLMREDVVVGLIDAGLDHYSYSFDAPDRQSYERLMQVDHFDRVWKNLDRIVDLRNARNSKMLITTHIMGFEEFRQSYEEFKAYWEKRVNLVYWREVGNWGGETWGLEEKLAEGGFTVPRAAQKFPRVPCTSIFMHFKLQHDGRYAPCVAAVPDYLPSEERHKVAYIGDAREITFMEAWQRLSDMRQAHLRGEWDRYECCSSCNIWGLFTNGWEDRGVNLPDRPRFHVPGIEIAQ
ncbi:radical SAM/SPASM domain-containing protein [Bradyrhizobium sp. CB3481]|uniref:radical SAM protein n=1 Tax=Bradyrhizobium sp. CB3481 TaxID=3039158 RepID=UPI0024B14AEC|nr:radical SAM/SPASM domain-containing protein [Bradyrhizobium sp. CB3481]WFU18956.1 radical SAM protein [Bradyrhizobium sp. CB3481]